jgi:hypothetical protein
MSNLKSAKLAIGLLISTCLYGTSASFAQLYTLGSGSVLAQEDIGGTVTFDTASTSTGSASVTTNTTDVASTGFIASTNALSLGMSDTRDGTSGDYSESQWGTYFTPTQNLTYTINGTYNASNSPVTFNTFLTQGSNYLYEGNITTPSGQQNLNLGTNVPIVQGSLTGTLLAGVQYDYSGTSQINSNGDTGASAGGNASISFAPLSPPQAQTLPAALNYKIVGAPIVAGGGPAVPNPGIDVSLNPQPLPPFPDPGASLSLTNPGDPILTDPAVASTYVIDFGMDAGGAVSFNVPNPSDPNDISFTATGPGGDPYTVTLDIGGGVVSPGSFVELNPQPLPPFPDPGYSFVEFQFSFEQAEDPTLGFQVSSGGTEFGFTTVPEPASFSLLGASMLSLLTRRGRRFPRA